MRNLGLSAALVVGPQLGHGARSLPSLQRPDRPCRGWDISWKELLVFPVQECVCADLPAGCDLPFVVQAVRVCACAQQEPLRELFARLTQLLGTKPTTLPLPSHAQTNPAWAGGLWLGRSSPALRGTRIWTPSSGSPTWTGTWGTGYSGAARVEGGQPRGVTGGRWDLELL